MLSAVISETMRLTSHSIGAIRKVVEPFALTMTDGRVYTLPRGYYFGFPLSALSHDERIWTNASEWQPERFLERQDEGGGVSGSVKFASAPFSGGVHACPGMIFATRAMHILLASVLNRYAVMEIAQPLPELTYTKATLAQRTRPVLASFLNENLT
jgi:cytochrome P450